MSTASSACKYRAQNSKFSALRGSKNPMLGINDVLGEGDSRLVLDVLPRDLADVAFEKLREEVAWDTMYHRGTLIAVLS